MLYRPFCIVQCCAVPFCTARCLYMSCTAIVHAMYGDLHVLYGNCACPVRYCNAGDTLCIPRLSAECTTSVIQHLPSLATEKLSVEKAKLEPATRLFARGTINFSVYSCYDQ